MAERAGGASRRTFLKMSLAGLGVLGLGVGALGLRAGADGPVPAGLKVLGPRTYRTLVAVADAICPGGKGLPAANVLGVAEKVDAVLDRMAPEDAEQVVLALGIVENALTGFLLEGRTTPLSRLDGAAVAVSLRGWSRARLNPQRTIFKALRGLCVTAYYADPRTFAASGYPGPPDFGQAGAPAVQPSQAELAAQAEMVADPAGGSPVGAETGEVGVGGEVGVTTGGAP